jgi:small conductance mechanosensitive channel
MNPIDVASDLPTSAIVELKDSVVGRLYAHYSGHDSTTGMRIVLIVVLALVAHVLVRIIRRVSEWIMINEHAQKSPFGFISQQPKFVTVTRLVVSGITFAIYFFALGLILQEFGVNLTAYLASASIIGLAISFGSQGLIQDIVIGLTLIFWDAMDVGDMVEIYASATIIGRVEEIGMRFTKITNIYNQEVFVPNRTIANVSRFPHGGVDAYADIQIPASVDRQKAMEVTAGVVRGMWVQFGALILSEPMIGPLETVPGGVWSFFRVHFKIWPGQGGLIENTFRQQAVRAMQALDPTYADWQIPVTYRAAVTKYSGSGPD